MVAVALDVSALALDVSKAEVISVIDAEKYKLALGDALQRLREAEQKLAANRAVGARPRDIIRQFLIEAVLISVVGG